MKENNYLLLLVTFILCSFGFNFLIVNADTGTTYYTYHYMVKGMQDLGSEVKHTTQATLYNPSGYIACSNTYLQDSEIPTPSCSSPSAYTYVIQLEANIPSQAHYHVSSAYPYDRFQSLTIEELFSLNK